MLTVHFIIMPLIIFGFSLLLQNWVGKSEFAQFYKMFAIGIAAGIIIHFIFSIISPFFLGKSHFITVLIKSIFIDGLLFSLLLLVSLHFAIEFFLDISLSFNWSMTAVVTFGYIGGIFTFLNIMQGFSGEVPGTLLEYIPYLSVILIVSILTGFFLPKYSDSFELWKKIIWAIIIILISTVLFGGLCFAKFYNFYEQYFIIVLLVPVLVIFEIADFRTFR